jgi:hypothetical protein
LPFGLDQFARFAIRSLKFLLVDVPSLQGTAQDWASPLANFIVAID